MNIRITIPAIAAAIAMSGCLLGNSSGGVASLEYISSSRTYTISGNNLILQASIDTQTYCQPGGGLETEIDSSRSDTTEFELEGDVFRLIVDFDSTASGALIKEMLVFGRSGRGTGIEGSWIFRKPEYRIVSGSLSAQEKAGLDSGTARFQYGTGFSTITMSFSKETVTTYRDGRTADLYMDRWNGTNPYNQSVADSLHLDVDARALDKYTVELKGRKNGETVRILIAPNGDMTHTSDKPGNAQSRYLREPKTCPNDVIPQWFHDFEAANAK